MGGLGLIPGSGRSPGERNGYSPQHPSLEKFVHRRARWATVPWVVESDAAEHCYCHFYERAELEKQGLVVGEGGELNLLSKEKKNKSSESLREFGVGR